MAKQAAVQQAPDYAAQWNAKRVEMRAIFEAALNDPTVSVIKFPGLVSNKTRQANKNAMWQTFERVCQAMEVS